MQQILINGAWVDAHDAASYGVMNPATLEHLGTVADCGAVDVERAVVAARAALPGWHRTPATIRAATVQAIGIRVRARQLEIAHLLSRETGKPLCEALDCLAAVADLFEQGDRPVAPVARAGVAVLLPPFDFPLLMMAGVLASELVSGRTAVCRAPQHNPLSTLLLAQSFDGLPAGIVNVITGGETTGRELLLQAGVAASAGAAAHHGSDAFMVCRDADLDLAVPAIAWTRLFNAGQACRSSKHVYVDRAIAGEFVDRMHPCAGFLDVDDPVRPATDIGPLISLDAAHHVEDQVGLALRAGARLILGGRRFRPSGLPGHFFQPTILADVPAGSLPTREPILGPVITVTPVSGMVEAIRFAADSAPGSGLSIYTADVDAATRLLDAPAAGHFCINDPWFSGAGPFGVLRDTGLRQAFRIDGEGIGRRGGILHTAARVEVKPWWFPYLKRKTS